MKTCSNCQNPITQSSGHCPVCRTAIVERQATYIPPNASAAYPLAQAGGGAAALPHTNAAPLVKGFAQSFGLHPMAATVVVATDWMLFGVEAVTLGAGWLASIPVGAGVGYAVYRIQRNFYGDDHDTALTKAFAVGLLTAIPAPLPTPLIVASGAMGLLKSWRKK